jgi:polysaccharide biosynthesis transport protein
MTKNLQQTPPSGLGVGDIAYVLFKHKWKLIVISLLGLIAAAVYYFRAPALWRSQAKLMVRYVVERSAVDQVQNTTSLSAGQGAEAVMQSELEILNSWDLAEKVAALPGMEELAPKSKTPAKAEGAALAIMEGLKAVAVKGSNVIVVEFKHWNREAVQKALDQLVQEYFRKHLEIHRSKEAAKFVSEKVEKSRTKLKGAEQDLMKLKSDSGVYSLPETIHSVNEEVAKLQNELNSAETLLAEHRARVEALEKFAATGKGEAVPFGPALTPAKPKDEEPAEGGKAAALSGGATPGSPDEVRTALTPEDSAVGSADNEYFNAVSGLKLLEAERVEMLKYYREEHYAVKELDEKISRQQRLIEIYKERSAEGSNRQVRSALLAAQSQTAALEARVEKIKEVQAIAQKNVLALTALMPRIAEMEMARDIEAGNYKYMSASLEKAQVDEALDGSKMPNISIVQEATPAVLDMGKRDKIALGIAGGTAAAAIALTLLFGLFLKRRVNRPEDLENRLGVPLLLSIPFFSRQDCLRLLQPKGANGSKALNQNDRLRLLHPKGTNGSAANGSAVNGSNGDTGTKLATAVEPPSAPWEAGHFIRPYSEAARDRLGLYFESRGITHKPKLIGVTGFSDGAGTSTLAAGLAAALSETGEGKVLMVDMTANGSEDDVHPFFAGRPAVALDDALKPAGNIESTADNLYLATADPNSPGSGSLGLNKLRRIMRDLKASDYDYMVFDMPALGQTSSTAAMAGLMDQVLVIVEGEASSPEEIKRGFRDLVESRAKVSVIFNKARSYGPKALVGGH